MNTVAQSRNRRRRPEEAGEPRGGGDRDGIRGEIGGEHPGRLLHARGQRALHVGSATLVMLVSIIWVMVMSITEIVIIHFRVEESEVDGCGSSGTPGSCPAARGKVNPAALTGTGARAHYPAPCRSRTISRRGSRRRKIPVTPERYAQGMTFEQYVAYVGSADNLAREGFGGYFPDGGSFGARAQRPEPGLPRALRARPAQRAAGGRGQVARRPARRTGAGSWSSPEDWSSDCRRDVPMLARLAEAGGLELRIFNRDGKKILGTRRPDPAAAPDGNHDLMLQFLEHEERRRVGLAAGGGVLHAGVPRASSVHRVSRHLSQGPGPPAAGPGPAGRERGAGQRSRRARVRGAPGFAASSMSGRRPGWTRSSARCTRS